MTVSQKRISPFVAGVMALCPRCGEGGLFAGFLKMRDSCTACGLDFRFADTGDGPAVFAIFILGFFVLGGALLVEFNFFPPLWVHVVLWGILTPLFALLLLRSIKALLFAFQYYHGAEEGRLDE